MEWGYALTGLVIGYFLCYMQSLNFSPESLRFKLEMLIWRLKFFLKHKLKKFW